jgi:hypothetical protein
MEHPQLVLVVEVDLDTHQVMVELVVLVVVEMVEIIQDKELLQPLILAVEAAEVPTLQQELLVVLVLLSLLIQQVNAII